MRASAAIGIALVFATGCRDRLQSAPMDAKADRADGNPTTDMAPQADATADAATDGPRTDLAPSDAADATRSDAATPDTTPQDAALPDTAGPDTGSPDTGPSDAGRDAPGDRLDAETRPPDPCATNVPLSTVGCNGEPQGPAPPNTYGGRCSLGDAGAASGTCSNTSHICVEGICLPLCEQTAVAEVSTGGCPTGYRCWNTGLLTFCFQDCRAATDCATGRCDSARGLCRGP